MALVVIRSLTRGVPIENGFRETSNWLIAALSGACAGWSSYNKDLRKAEKEKKRKTRNKTAARQTPGVFFAKIRHSRILLRFKRRRRK